MRTWPQKSKLFSVLLILYSHSDMTRLLELVFPEAISKGLRLGFDQRAQLFSALSYPCLHDLINPDVKALIPERERKETMCGIYPWWTSQWLDLLSWESQNPKLAVSSL